MQERKAADRWGRRPHPTPRTWRSALPPAEAEALQSRLAALNERLQQDEARVHQHYSDITQASGPAADPPNFESRPLRTFKQRDARRLWRGRICGYLVRSNKSMLKVAFLGAWHSHAAMHVREAAARAGRGGTSGDVRSRSRSDSAESGAVGGTRADIPVFASIEDVLNVLRTDPGALHLSVRIVLRLPRRAIPLQPIALPASGNSTRAPPRWCDSTNAKISSVLARASSAPPRGGSPVSSARTKSSTKQSVEARSSKAGNSTKPNLSRPR